VAPPGNQAETEKTKIGLKPRQSSVYSTLTASRPYATAVWEEWFSSLTAVFVFIKSTRTIGAEGGNRYQHQIRRFPYLPPCDGISTFGFDWRGGCI
jgi:hypothetical protein